MENCHVEYHNQLSSPTQKIELVVEKNVFFLRYVIMGMIMSTRIYIYIFLCKIYFHKF